MKRFILILALLFSFQAFGKDHGGSFMSTSSPAFAGIKSKLQSKHCKRMVNNSAINSDPELKEFIIAVCGWFNGLDL